MAEIEIDASYGLYARWLHPLAGHPGRNLFDPAAQSDFSAEPFVSTRTAKLSQLRTAGIVADDTDGFGLAPLRGLLVLPRSAPSDGTPLALIVHGAAAAFRPAVVTAANEVPSFRGYLYFQRHLATLGVASLSVNANIVNHFMGNNTDDDYDRRNQLLILHFALLSALAAGAAPTGTPLRCRLPRGMVTLRDALTQPATQPTGGPDAQLRELMRLVRAAELDLTRLAVMGHSRGATAVCEFAQRVQAAAGSAFPAASPSSGGAGSAQVIDEQRANVEGLIRTLGAPLPAHLKLLFPLEPDNHGPFPLALPDVFLLAVAGTHDEDVSSAAANIYDGAGCPKAVVQMHGATHARFNTVWRDLPTSNRVINESIRCQTSAGGPIRILSNASHEELLKAFGGAAISGRLRNQPNDLLIFTGEQRGPQGTDVTRAWRYPVPVNDATRLASLDSGISLPQVNTHASVINGDFVFAQQTMVFRIARPASQSATLTVPIAADQLPQFTHLSCRMAKEHDPNNARARASEPLRNFSLSLFTDTGLQIGATISGSAVRSIIHSVYPVRKWTQQDGEVCYNDNRVWLQTIEVPLTQFLTRTRFTASDLGRVRELRFDMLPVTKAGEDVFCLADFTLTRRN